ncbi:MAG: hypothetical protein LUF30_02140 [Lachnospiraceae bacterium]|nr:hypothetical protein [Lachnospiraceae bacterium]
MKRRIMLLVATMMLKVTGSSVFANEAPDAIIVDETEAVLVENGAETEADVEETEIKEALVETVEEVSEEEPATVQEDEDEPATIASSGTCGDNLTWTLDNSGVLTISGTGPMYNFTTASNEPWATSSASIKTVIVLRMELHLWGEVRLFIVRH